MPMRKGLSRASSEAKPGRPGNIGSGEPGEAMAEACSSPEPGELRPKKPQAKLANRLLARKTTIIKTGAACRLWLTRLIIPFSLIYNNLSNLSRSCNMMLGN